MTKATLRWVTSPLNKSNQILLRKLNGIENVSNSFLTPYIVEDPGKPPVLVKKKYVFNLGELTEYYYEIDGPSEAIQDLCSRSREVAYTPLELTYVIPNPEEMVHSKDLYGLLPILKTLIRKELLGEAENPFGNLQINKVIYNYFKNPAYITFTALEERVLPTTFDILDEYRAKLPNPLGTSGDKFYFEPVDNGSTMLGPVYVSEKRLADIRSKINIGELVGWTLLHPTPMPYYILDEWCRAHDYLRETALKMMKRVGSEKDIVLIRNDLVYADPESIFWDLRSRSIINEDRGWFVYKIPEVSLSQDVDKVYEEIFHAFDFQKRTIPEYPQEMILNNNEKYRYAFGFDVKKWLEETKSNIFNELPPILRLEGDWMRNYNLPLTSENLAKITYAAYRSYAEIMQNSLDYAQFSDMIVTLPDFSVSLPIYNLDDLKAAKYVIESVLENPDDIKAVICKGLGECIASRNQTLLEQENSVPFLMEIGENLLLASDSELSLVKKPKDFPEEALEDGLDALDPGVQGFLDLGNVKGAIRIKEVKEFSMISPNVRILEIGNNIVVNVEVDDERNYDLFAIPKPKRKDRVRYIQDIESKVKDLWSKGWFLTNWGRFTYKTTGKFSKHLIKDVQSEICSLEDLESL